MFYRHNKTFWYQFCNFKHFLKAENSEDSSASSCVGSLLVCHVTQYETGTLGYYWNKMLISYSKDLRIVV